ncbi:HECT-domain-containing protein [Tuber magnatum]|uniref:HECT-type E3 ubiquitin transferase n=1 Tax=Tuber magnatum TaxID=42249 RepID=A0A317SWN5_9PEZI|nr:HECT-domain-containing protein [Tuber magnatum]
MCCDCTVRWPSDLNVFRCTVCMTINDLKPVPLGPPGATDTPSREVPPVSLAGTKAIIDICVEEYLDMRKWVKQVPAYAPPSPPMGGREEGSMPNDIPGTLNTFPVFDSRGPSVSLLSRSEGAVMPPTSAPSVMPPVSDALGSLPGVSGRERGEVPVGDVKGSYEELAKNMFKRLEDYLFLAFNDWECLNGSFVKERKGSGERNKAEGAEISAAEQGGMSRGSRERRRGDIAPATEKIGEKEAMLLMGRGRVAKDKGYDRPERADRSRADAKLSVRSPSIDWDAVSEFYDMIMNAGGDYPLEKALRRSGGGDKEDSGEQFERLLPRTLGWEDEIMEISAEIGEARNSATRVLLKATESILKRPRRPLKKPEEVRFLLIILANPLLYPSSSRASTRSSSGMASSLNAQSLRTVGVKLSVPKRYPSNSSSHSGASGGPGHHSGIIKRILGLLSNLPNECHHYLVSWFTRMPETQFRRLIELVGSFITYRLTRQQGRKRSHAGGPAASTGKQLSYHDDWQIRAAARVMSLFFSANNNTAGRRGPLSSGYGVADDGLSYGQIARREAQRRGQIIPTSEFYNMLLDYHDLIADFDVWESRASRFCFCQYPFLLSMGAKISILEHDAKRQMEVQARHAFFNSIASRRTINQYLVLKVRRECLVEDSLKGISEGVGSLDDIKKGLRIEFIGEDGVDAGGLKKEWFLLVARDVFDPNYGMFAYDDDSQYCYFNPNSLESSEEFFLVGVLFGLAIYNSTILDVALPPYIFKKLLHSTTVHGLAVSSIRPPLHHTLEDLAVFRPSLAHGLSQLLEYEGDVESTFCRDFVIETERFGQVTRVPLCPNGENRPVTNSNRREFVDLYLNYLLNSSVAKQFEPFKRGFYTVCGGNALSLFRPEEIELLIRGSDEALDVSALKAVAIYDGWGSGNPAENDPIVKWFWSFFERITPKEQRMLLSFITGSDRIPAMGATNLIIKVVCLGQDSNRFPVARTCFNQICLWRYRRREKLETLLWRAVTESEGFGLK